MFWSVRGDVVLAYMKYGSSQLRARSMLVIKKWRVEVNTCCVLKTILSPTNSTLVAAAVFTIKEVQT